MSDIDLIKDRLSIVDVVQGYVKLTRAGKYWKGLSPFTKEKTPSFFVSPDKGLYHCFSTGKGGDMFTFVAEMEGLDFKGALRVLAERAGVELARESRESRDERAELYAALEEACALFEAELARREDPRRYLASRGIDPATVAHWRIGYAPKEWRFLYEKLAARGFSDAALMHAGLVKRPDREGAERVYDRFRGRIMFPLFDPSGRVIAFSGRIFEDEAEPQAKYLNSPEGPLFDKSRALYGIQDAKAGIRTLGFCMLVEGQVDLILMHQLGYRSAVATSGTAFSEHHVEALKRHSSNVLIAYDGDRAGIAAAHRAALMCLAAGMNVKVLALPNGMDPADMALRDPQGLKAAVRAAVPAVQFFLTQTKVSGDPRTRLRMAETLVLPLIGAVRSSLERDYFIRYTAEFLGVSEDAVRSALTMPKTAPVEGRVADPLMRSDARELLLFGIEATLRISEPALADEVRDAFLAEFGAERLDALTARGETFAETARMYASEHFFADHAPAEVRPRVTELVTERNPERRKLRDAYATALRALRDAERSGDVERARVLMDELALLTKKLK